MAEQTQREITTLVSLTNDEIILLDGRCRDKIQAEVNRVKLENDVLSAFTSLPPLQAETASRIAAVAMANGVLETSCVIMDGLPCSCCDKRTRYATYKRSSYYHRKGDPNHKKPIHVRGVHFPKCFVCCDCWAAIKPLMIPFLEDRQTEIDTRFFYPDDKRKSRWKKSCNRKCRECGWMGHEGEMKFVQKGHYSPARPKCPHCGVEDSSMYLGNKLIRIDGFVMIDREIQESNKTSAG